ncbi:MAG TPA: hypothetical protein VEL28_06820 [Candidatus Binatia bacterium]|nr:hypothetical protein [Candidatus Binatia bacterium]
MRRWFTISVLFVQAAHAEDLAVVPSKLIVVDAPGKSKVTLFVTDDAVAKGPGTSSSDVSATVHLGYGHGTATFVMPQGDNWQSEQERAKYFHGDAPAAGSVKKHGIRVGKSLKMKASSLGEIPLDISSAPGGPVTFAEVRMTQADCKAHPPNCENCAQRCLCSF